MLRTTYLIIFLILDYSFVNAQCDSLVIYTVADSSERFIAIDCDINTPYDFIDGDIGTWGNQSSLKYDNQAHPFTPLKLATEDYELMDYPIRTNVALVWGEEDREQGATCTGTLIGENMVVTDAHCIGIVNSMDEFVWKGRRGLYVSPAHQDGYPQPSIGKIKVTHIIIQKTFYEHNYYSYDFALLILEEPVGQSIGYMGVSYYDFPGPLNDSTLSYTFGYPASEGYEGKNMVESYGHVDDNTNRLNFGSGITFITGQSGSSVFNYNPETNLPLVYGLVVYANPGINFQRIRKEQFAAILAIKQDFGIITGEDWKQDELETQISINPNPTKGSFTIKNLSKNKIATYQVVDEMGQILQTGKMNSEEAQISIQNLPAGIYIFKAISSHSSYSQKIVKL